MTGLRAGVARHRAQVRQASAGTACQKRQAVPHRKQRIMPVAVRPRIGITGSVAIAPPAFTAFNGCAEYREHSAAPPADTRVSPP